MAADTLRSRLDMYLAEHDRVGAVVEARDAVRRGAVDASGLYEILAGILVDIGSSWQRGTAEIWQEHLISGIVRNIVETCSMEVEAVAPRTRRGTVVLAAPDDEYHDIGLRMLTDRFTLAGWQTHFLGANVPRTELTKAVEELGGDAVVLSASTHYHRLNLRSYVADLTRFHPELRVWVGGPAFAHGHDGWDDDQILQPGRIPSPEER